MVTSLIGIPFLLVTVNNLLFFFFKKGSYCVLLAAFILVLQVGEARALYNLGNVHHAKGKHTGRCGDQDPGEFPPEVKDCLQKAAEFYE